MPLTSVTKDLAPIAEDPATTAEGAPAFVAVATTEGDTTAPAEVSPTAFADVDETAGQPTLPTGVTEDLASTAEGPATIADGDPIAAVDLAAMAVDDD
ncbi:hypothetical protein E2562_001525 [Oryza meyeriana var. granulata]|uniref:Uncharacterized protein n=1 Tax=Oryza meyeriana var. granulata TaxID=110450 RepID=A0A6G1DC31_9ORYZ|nr:hypothetical protein E2562_001525 [Oryza meyeriana var. granulata]